MTQQRTAEDFALCMQYLVDVLFPFTHLIHVVLDNLNTHTPAALYQTFDAAQARRIQGTVTVSLHSSSWQLVKSGRTGTIGFISSVCATVAFRPLKHCLEKSLHGKRLATTLKQA